MEIKRRLVTCTQGHIYNANANATCPFCGSPEAGAAASNTPGAFPRTMAPEESVNVNVQQQASSVGHTMPVTPYDEVKTGSFQPTVLGDDLASDGQVDPVVGWLVCIEGPMRGVDFRIHNGYNYIGREIGDIHISGDQQISAEKHAVIAFDAAERLYYFAPSAGRNIVRVNGKTVMNSVEIKSYDIISIGASKMLFIGLCGEQFMWNEA